MSMTPEPRHSVSYQWVEKPWTGKVSPPSGPWKDSTRMVSVGP